MRALAFDVSCLRCGGEVEHVNSLTTTTGTHAAAVLACGDCGNQWEVYITMRRHAVDPANAERQRERRAVAA